jgi:hypothetical protein
MGYTYLESHVGLLSRGDVLAGGGDGDHGNVIIVALKGRRKGWLVSESKTVYTYSEELLSSSEGVSDDEGGAEGEDNVLVIGVEDKSTVDLACTQKVD